MTSAYILIAAILVLGGVIAAVGDRIGTRVGKKRLRLFDLRPKQTAILVTIITGTVIAASTLGIIFSLSKSLRQGVFQLDEILQKRRHVEAELREVTEQKKAVERELAEAQVRQEEASGRLQATGQELAKTQVQLTKISQQAAKLRQEVGKILREQKLLLEQKQQLQAQISNLRVDIAQKDRELDDKQGQIETQDRILREQEIKLESLERQQAQLQKEIDSRDRQINKLDELIALKDGQLKEKTDRLSLLEKELNFLQQKVDVLEQYYLTYQELREKEIAMVKGQVLTVGLVKISDPQMIPNTIDRLLREANKNALKILGYPSVDPPPRIIQITKVQVEQLISDLKTDGQYLVRIISAGNYVRGEQEVRIFADVSPNQKIYDAEQIIANVSLEGEAMTPEEIQKRLDFLISVTRFRARRAGVLGPIVIGDGKVISLFNFIEQLGESDRPLDEIQAIATETTYTSGPLQITLLVMARGEEILRL